MLLIKRLESVYTALRYSTKLSIVTVIALHPVHVGKLFNESLKKSRAGTVELGVLKSKKTQQPFTQYDTVITMYYNINNLRKEKK